MFCEPIGLEAVYAVLKRDHVVKVLDMMIEKNDLVEECRKWKPDVVGLTSLCIDVKNVLNLARNLKTQLAILLRWWVARSPLLNQPPFTRNLSTT